jgi:hypothetical protein
MFKQRIQKPMDSNTIEMRLVEFLAICFIVGKSPVRKQARESAILIDIYHSSPSSSKKRSDSTLK